MVSIKETKYNQIQLITNNNKYKKYSIDFDENLGLCF